ncbi:hypothetical protein B0H17DRAFT_1331490 [Mycena rosella]|uniref:NACHT domain-containing protein n=1 Tax=Mycena rosella TaxID=1033263 RepID=A0AAD7GI82_MYCRO|nr:hypothetical protein B0H17DRAFT_1331490 [Mycena rosella]
MDHLASNIPSCFPLACPITPGRPSRPLLALVSTSPSYAPHRHRLAPLLLITVGGFALLALLALAAVLAPTVGLPKEYYQRPLPPAGNALPPPARPDGHAPFDGSPSSSPPSSTPDAEGAFFAFGRERQCLVDAYDGVHADFRPFWRAGAAGMVPRQRAEGGGAGARLKMKSRGLTAIRVQDGEAHLPGYQGAYFDGTWETTIIKSAFLRLRPTLLTVLIDGRDEPRVVFGTLPSFEGAGPLQFPSATTILASILPVLRLAKAGVTGIGIPGVEGAVNAVCEVADMISTMKANKEDLSKLANLLDKLTTINASGVGGDLKQRLTALSFDLGEIKIKCKSLGEKGRFKQFLKGSDYKQQIEEIKDSVAAQIQQFTFYGNISIEKSVDTILNVLILSKLKTAPARYNAENTPNKCMEGTRVDIIKDVIAQLTSTPGSFHQVLMLSGVAGSGKSTIAKSVASVLAENQQLAASFFFSRDYEERKEITHLATTLAVQLAEYDGIFRTHLIHFLQMNSDGIIDAEPHLKFQKMILDILEKMPPSLQPWIICLDALDECGKDRGQLFLRWLSDSISRIPKHIRFFLTGRPDVPSYLKFHTLLPMVHSIILDNIDPTVVSQDISLGMMWTK